MKIIFMTLLVFLMTACASNPEVTHPSGLTVEEINPDKLTALTKQNLLQLTQVYDLAPFFYSKRIQIQTGADNKSHPVILLNTRFVNDPKKLLASFLHEELQWWLTDNKLSSTLALKDLEKLYPNPPRIKGASKNATYYKLIVCYLEVQALEHYLGRKEARKVVASMIKKDRIYPWSYSQALYKSRALKDIIEKRNLLPPVLN